MLNVFKCPCCRKLIKTDQGLGRKIACPHCEEEFTLRSSHEVRSSAVSEALFRLAIPLGYALFVAVPLGLTIWFLVNRVERQQKEEAEAAAAAAVVVPGAPEPRNDRKPPAPPAPRPPRKVSRAPVGRPDTTEPEPEVTSPYPKERVPMPEPEVTAPRPKVPMPEPEVIEPKLKVEVALAPLPRELPEVFVAPEPREIVWKLPPSDYVSAWQKVGMVDLRVGGVAVARVPIIDGKERVRDSAQPVLVVVIEVRANASAKKRELQSWTHGQKRYMAGFLAGGKDLPYFDLPLGSKVNTGLPLKQPLLPDGEPVHDVLVFVAPPEGAGELSVRLDGDRLGEPGDVWVKIPPTAWKK